MSYELHLLFICWLLNVLMLFYVILFWDVTNPSIIMIAKLGPNM